MDAPMSEGLVTLNAEGKRYTASFRIERGVITVTSGSVSKRVGCATSLAHSRPPGRF